MLTASHVKRFAKMDETLRKAFETAGIDPAFAIVMKNPTAEEAENDEIIVNILVAADQKPTKTDLRRRKAIKDDMLSPEGGEVLYLIRPDASAGVCRKVGSTWLWT